MSAIFHFGLSNALVAGGPSIRRCIEVYYFLIQYLGVFVHPLSVRGGAWHGEKPEEYRARGDEQAVEPLVRQWKRSSESNNVSEITRLLQRDN